MHFLRALQEICHISSRALSGVSVVKGLIEYEKRLSRNSDML